jgi:hypothetical protein
VQCQVGNRIAEFEKLEQNSLQGALLTRLFSDTDATVARAFTRVSNTVWLCLYERCFLNIVQHCIQSWEIKGGLHGALGSAESGLDDFWM